jgi:succinate dehydrogenase, cytochrome b556 subunit
MLVSILHRVTGNGMAIAGLGLLLWWLGALASGPAAYATFTWALTTPIGYIVMVGITWAFFTHLMSGLRHFVMDVGGGYELKTNKTWSVLCPVLGVVLTAAFWALLLLR